MNKIFFMKSAAVAALLFSLLTIVEGSLVLLGITQHEYTVFTPLLILNVIMAVAGLFVGVMIWFNYKKAVMLTAIVVVILLTVTIAVTVIHIYNGAVTMHSVLAMTIRTSLWLIIALVTWKTNRSNKINIGKPIIDK